MIATLLPFLFWSLLFEMVNVQIDLFDNKSTNLAEIYLLMIVLDKITIAAWAVRHKIETKFKSRVLAYSFGCIFFIIIMLYVLYLTYNDISWQT